MTFKLIGCTLALSILLLAISFVPQVIYPNQVLAQDEAPADDSAPPPDPDAPPPDDPGAPPPDAPADQPADAGPVDQPADTGATTDPSAIDPDGAVPSEVGTETATPGLPGPDATQGQLAEGVTINPDDTATITPDSPVYDAAVNIARAEGQTIDVSDLPPGVAQPGDVIETPNGYAEVVDSRASTPTVDTPQEVDPGTPVDTDGDGVIDSIAQDTDGDGTSDTFISPFALPQPKPGMRPWIQTFGGDVHSNGTINTPGGP